MTCIPGRIGQTQTQTQSDNRCNESPVSMGCIGQGKNAPRPTTLFTSVTFPPGESKHVFIYYSFIYLFINLFVYFFPYSFVYKFVIYL